MMPSLLSAWILNLSDRIFIERYFSLSDVGIYSLGYKIAELVLIFSGAFYTAYNPVFYKLANSENQMEAKRKLYKYNTCYVLLIMMSVFLISIFSKEAITLLLDPKYLEAYKIVPIIALAYFISQTSGLLNLSIYQEKKTLQMMYMILGSAGLNILLNFLLVPKLGAYGAAYATVLSFAAFFMVKYWYAKKCYFIPFNWNQIALIFAPLFAIVLLFQFIININIHLSLIIKVLVCGIIGLFFMKKYYPQVKLMLVKK
jgi:O-antigen/teichoic acid export membrane protein